MGNDQGQFERALERVEAMEALAERILAECRVTLMMSFRFLDRALWKMPYRSLRLSDRAPKLSVSARTSLSADGHALHYNAKAVIQAFRINPDLVVRSYLHALLHCIFRHPFATVRVDPDAWSLACDVCVEAIALEMCDGRFALEGDDAVRELAARAGNLFGGLTPSKLYRALLLGKREEADAAGMRMYAELNAHGDLFARDDHQLWDLVKPPEEREQEPPPDAPGEGGGGGEQPDEPGSDPESPDGADADESTPSDGSAPDADAGDGPDPSSEGENGNGGDDDEQGGQGEGGGRDDQHRAPSDEGRIPPRQQAGSAPEPAYAEGDMPEAGQLGEQAGDEEEWEQIARQVETELRTMQKERGEGAGTFMDNLALANRSRIDYADFLRRFSTRAEDAKLNDEEFDYIFYTYGLRLYENMPLVEPLEYAETDRVREFVIAIDTSGSCSRGLVQVFLTRTYEILSRGSAFDERVNVHIVQCDADIQSVEVIRDIDELAAYERGFEVRGYGGTDFRPVFAYVDDLIARREFTDLRGLVYFTDGYGTFPSCAPDYDVAFVFVEEDGHERRVPPWAMKVVLDEDAIYEMECSRDAR